MEPELEDVVVELAAEPALVSVLPLPVDNLEGDVFVGWTRHHLQDAEVPVVRGHQGELGRLRLQQEQLDQCKSLEQSKAVELPTIYCY